MQDAPGRKRCSHPTALKAQILAVCAQSGASIARIALEHGIKADLVHRWRRIAGGVHVDRTQAVPRLDGFVPLPVSSPMISAVADIRIEHRRGSSSVTIACLISAASERVCWHRELFFSVLLTRQQDPDKGGTIESRLDRVADTLRVIPKDAAAFRARVRLIHRKSDEVYEAAMFAATALAHDLTEVTRNTSDFDVFGVRRLNPLFPQA